MLYKNIQLLPIFLSIQACFASQNKGCEKLKKPHEKEKALTARWLIHSVDWGVVSTITTRTNIVSRDIDDEQPPMPFGNIFSVSDGTCDKTSSTGIPYVYATEMDQTWNDIDSNPYVSLTITEASLLSDSQACSTHGYGDPENPPCVRLVVTGKLVKVTDEEEIEFGKQALFSRHPVMSYWPDDHEFFVAKIEIEDLWMLDWFGGATILDIDEYFDVSMDLLEGDTPILNCGFCQDVASIIRLGL